jgi:hypothetical protein
LISSGLNGIIKYMETNSIRLKYVLIIGIFIFLIAFFPRIASAHQPRIVEGAGIVKIENPEISKAYYGELNGKQAEFRIESADPFKLYVNILVPDLPGIGKDKSFDVYALNGKTEEVLYRIDGINSGWTPFFESFARDNYFKGPELREDAGAGAYIIKVFSPENKGKYVLAVGEKEEFSLSEILNSINTVPRLKAGFFGKSIFGAYFNIIGAALFGSALIIVILGFFVQRIYIRRKMK